MHWAYSVFGVDDVTPFKIRCISLHQRIIKKLLYVILNILLYIPPRANNFKPKTREICTNIIKTTWCTEIRLKKSYILIFSFAATQRPPFREQIICCCHFTAVDVLYEHSYFAKYPHVFTHLFPHLAKSVILHRTKLPCIQFSMFSEVTRENENQTTREHNSKDRNWSFFLDKLEFCDVITVTYNRVIAK